MNNFEKIKYTYLHRKALMYFIKENKYLEDDERSELIKRAEIHDMDKMVLLLFHDKKWVSFYHRNNNAHHIKEYIANSNEPEKIDLLEAIFDFECAALTKPDKPLNAFDTINTYYKEYMPLFSKYLIKLHMNRSYIAVTDEAKKYMGSFCGSEAEILDEIKAYLKTPGNIYEKLGDKCCSKEEYDKSINS